MLRTLLLSGFALASPAALFAQQPQAWIRHWENIAQRVQSQEPHWATPLITNTPVLDQSLRADFQHGTEAGNQSLWNLTSSKGAKLIVAPRSEVDINFVPWFIHSNGVHNGFGDASFAYKYRVFSRVPGHGNALVTAIVQATVPTGTYANGAVSGTITPLLSGGKGWGWFDVISTVGGQLPTSHSNTSGRQISWNTAAQAQLSKHWYTELEDNATYVHGGTKDGQETNYLTPALISRWRNESRRGVTLGVGMEFATSRTHTLDHNLILSSRIHF